MPPLWSSTNNGVLTREYIPHDNTNVVRSLEGKVNQRNVWIRVESVDPKTTQVDVQARGDWGGAMWIWPTNWKKKSPCSWRGKLYSGRFSVSKRRVLRPAFFVP